MKPITRKREWGQRDGWIPLLFFFILKKMTFLIFIWKNEIGLHSSNETKEHGEKKSGLTAILGQLWRCFSRSMCIWFILFSFCLLSENGNLFFSSSAVYFYCQVWLGDLGGWEGDGTQVGRFVYGVCVVDPVANLCLQYPLV